MLKPEQNSEFNTTKINVTLNIYSLKGYSKYSFDNKAWSSFTNKQGVSSKYIYAKEGFNTLYFKAQDTAGAWHYSQVNFFVDSKKPYISSMYPYSGSFTNGDFLVKYTEDYLQKVELYIAPPNSTSYNLVASSTECPSGTSKNCTLSTEVSQWSGQKIKYYFKIYDKFFWDDYTPKSVNIDTISPIITINSFNKISENYERYKANISVSEKVDLKYKTSLSSSIYSICADCDHYIKSFSFTRKPEWIDIIAIDKAKSQDIERININ